MLIRTLRLTLLLLLVTPAAFAQDNPPKSVKPQPEAKKAFNTLKTLTGSWQGTIMGTSINFTIRAASSGTAILHEGNTTGGGPPQHEITMFYLEGDRLLATHYCDGGSRPRLEGKMSPAATRRGLGYVEDDGS